MKEGVVLEVRRYRVGKVFEVIQIVSSGWFESLHTLLRNSENLSVLQDAAGFGHLYNCMKLTHEPVAGYYNYLYL